MANDLGDRFPRLTEGSYRITSKHDDRYNCVAWIVRDMGRRWEPAIDGGYWPRAVDPSMLDPDDDLDEFLWMFTEFGFEECLDGDLEEGIEKIAIYALGSSFHHVAYQASDGQWSSKLGFGNDIRHLVPSGLVGPLPGAYPDVAIYMARSRQPHELADSPTGLILP